MLTMSMTPKMRLRPAAMSAYTPPVSTPSTIAWTRSVSDTRSRPYARASPATSLPGGLRIDRLHVALRPDRDRWDLHAVLPLERRRLQRGVHANRVELHRALHAVERDVAVQVGDDLLVVE